jgi:hypothetical protein
VIKFVSYLQQVGGFLRVLQFPSSGNDWDWNLTLGCQEISLSCTFAGVWFYFSLLSAVFSLLFDSYVHLYIPYLVFWLDDFGVWVFWSYNVIYIWWFGLGLWCLTPLSVYSIKLYVIKFVSYLQQVGGFLRVLQFPPPIKLGVKRFPCLALLPVLDSIYPVSSVLIRRFWSMSFMIIRPDFTLNSHMMSFIFDGLV